MSRRNAGSSTLPALGRDVEIERDRLAEQTHFGDELDVARVARDEDCPQRLARVIGRDRAPPEERVPEDRTIIRPTSTEDIGHDDVDRPAREHERDR